MSNLEAIRKLAQELSEDKDPRWKGQWELGYDAGAQEAGQRLTRLLKALQ